MSHHDKQLRLDRESMQRNADATKEDRFYPWKHGVLHSSDSDEQPPRLPQPPRDTEKKE